MVAFNFQKQFVPMIKAGRKRHTIRQSSRGAKPGSDLQLYTGQRTTSCKLIARVVCRSVRPVNIFSRPGIGTGWEVVVGNQKLSAAKLSVLAKADGFDATDEFLAFFDKQYGLPFYGELVEWFPLEIKQRRTKR